MPLRTCLALLLISLIPTAATRAADAPPTDPLARWRANVTIAPLSPTPDRHTIHSYYLTCPESPDGKRVLFYTSTTADGQTGDIRIIDRANGTETIIAKNVHSEDAHRAACQQWTSNGARVAFHDVRDGKWGVYVVDLDTMKERTIALDRQIGFGQPAGNLLPLYGCHWNPGQHRDLELADPATGDIRTALKIGEVEKTYGDWLKKQFADKSTSIFFPVVSPDQKRVFFKMAAGNGGDNFAAKSASAREGLIAADINDGNFLFLRPKWGHPAWYPDSRHIIEVGNLCFDSGEKGKMTRIAEVPVLKGGPHLSVSPDGKLFVTDGDLGPLGDKPGQWGIMVCDINGGKDRFQVLHKFDNSQGAKSWRKNHPHPIFSADGSRIYFNTNESQWTRLFVAEAGK